MEMKKSFQREDITNQPRSTFSRGNWRKTVMILFFSLTAYLFKDRFTMQKPDICLLVAQQILEFQFVQTLKAKSVCAFFRLNYICKI